MSLTKFELKEEHVKLLKQMNWSLWESKFLVSVKDIKEDADPFGGNDIYESVDLILNGRPADFDPFNTHDFKEYTKEQKSEWDILISELPLALDVILYNGNFELGKYKTKFEQREWKKI